MDRDRFFMACEFVSLAITPSTIILSVLVVYLWGKTAWKALWKSRRNRTSACYFCMGVTIGFLGGIGDNGFWAVPWSYSFIGDQDGFNAWAQWGALFNIVFRQVCGTVAAYLHVRSYEIYHKDPSAEMLLRYAVMLSIVIGFAYTSLLLCIRWYW